MTDDASDYPSAHALREILAVAERTHVAWRVLVAVAALLSAVDLARASGGGWTLHIAVNGTTVGIVALFWLPPLIRVLALTGGRLKALGGEANLNGLLDASRPASTALAALDLAANSDSKPVLEQARALVRREIGGLSATAKAVRERLAEIARAYETLRRSEAPTDERTLELEALLQEVGLLADAAQLAPQEILEWFRRPPSQRQRRDLSGYRVVAIRLMASHPELEFVLPLLDAIEHRRSHFEQYHALQALEMQVDLLDEGMKQSVRSRLEKVVSELDDEAHDSTRKIIAERIIGVIS